MSSRLRRVAVLLLAPIAACAGGAAPATNAAPQDAPAEASEGRGRVTPPRMLGSTTPPAVGQLRVRRAGAPNAPSMRRAAADRLTVEVRIDADGKPDMSSLVIRGRDAELNRERIAEWIGTATFAPAQRDGVPVAGVFRRTL